MSQKSSDNSLTVRVPWSGRAGIAEDRVLRFPPGGHVDRLATLDVPPAGDGAVHEAFCRALGTPQLQALARGKRRVLLAVEDATRPSRLAGVLAAVWSALDAAGVSSDAVRVVVCSGAHGPSTREELIAKYGAELFDRFLVLHHDPHENLADTEVVLGKTPLRLNRYFVEADLRILVGSVIPHAFAGFSAGAKLIIPGLADIASLERTHKYVMMGFRGGVDDVENNRFRSEIEGAVTGLGEHFFVGAVPNARREVAGLFTGDLVLAHRAAVEFARGLYRTSFRTPYDLAVLNAFPKDGELLQADTALTPLTSCAIPLVKEGGAIVLASSSPGGLGHHGLFGPGMRLHRKPTRRRALGDRKLIVYSPNINPAEFREQFWDGYAHAREWPEVLDFAKEHLAPGYTACVLPTAPLQLLAHDDGARS